MTPAQHTVLNSILQVSENRIQIQNRRKQVFIFTLFIFRQFQSWSASASSRLFSLPVFSISSSLRHVNYKSTLSLLFLDHPFTFSHRHCYSRNLVSAHYSQLLSSYSLHLPFSHSLGGGRLMAFHTLDRILLIRAVPVRAALSIGSFAAGSCCSRPPDIWLGIASWIKMAKIVNNMITQAEKHEYKLCSNITSSSQNNAANKNVWFWLKPSQCKFLTHLVTLWYFDKKWI